MGFARAANVPVVLIGDIDRGGVIAQIVRTTTVIDVDDRAMLRGFLVNKFRGDAALFADGMREIAQRSGCAGWGSSRISRTRLCCRRKTRWRCRNRSGMLTAVAAQR